MKIMVYLMGVVFITLAFIGVILIFYTSITPTFHAYLWPALISIGCAGYWLTAKGKGLKILLATVALTAALWIMLNSIYIWVTPPEGSWIADLLSPPSMALSATGALLIVFGSLAGILGAMKY